MNITIFNRRYWIRRFGEQQYVNGYATNGYRDFVASLHVHPMGVEQMQALPEGERRVRRLEAHGTDVLIASDENSNQKGDLLFYDGWWYECTAVQRWDHTLLSHINYQFTIVPRDASNSIDVLNPPKGDPNDGGCHACRCC